MAKTQQGERLAAALKAQVTEKQITNFMAQNNCSKFDAIKAIGLRAARFIGRVADRSHPHDRHSVRNQ